MEKTLLALDISTKTGWAVFKLKDDKIVGHTYGTFFPNRALKDFGKYPESYMKWADYTADEIYYQASLLQVNHPELQVVIEETTKGKNNYSQKILEFIHYCVISKLAARKIPMEYVRTGVWRKIVGANQNESEKALNKEIVKIKKQTQSKLAKIDGKVVGRRTKKHSAIRCFKEHFGIELPKKMEDAVDASLLGLAYIKGAPVCDGTLKGGNWSK